VCIPRLLGATLKLRTKSLAYLASSFGLLALVGCNPSPEQPLLEDRFAGLEEAVRAELRDPTSAMFRNIRSDRPPFVCGEVNSKNGFGGYAGWLGFHALRAGGAWHIDWASDETPFVQQQFAEDCEAG